MRSDHVIGQELLKLGPPLTLRILLYRANVLRVLFRELRRCLFLLRNTLSCFIHCDCSGFLAFVVRVRSRRHKSSYLKIVQRLRPDPNQLVSFNGKANSKERSHRESCDSKSDDICNFHDLFSEACCPLHRFESRRQRKPLRKNQFSFFVFSSLACALVNTLNPAGGVVSSHGEWS